MIANAIMMGVERPSVPANPLPYLRLISAGSSTSIDSSVFRFMNSVDSTSFPAF